METLFIVKSVEMNNIFKIRLLNTIGCDEMKCGNCKLWVYSLQYETLKDIKRQDSENGKVLGACSYNGYFYPRFNYEKCPFVDRKHLFKSN